MSIHIEAERGRIAETVLLPGDPLRARFVAEHYLESPELYNEVRGMLGYTGTWNGTRVSVQGSGMGQPSLSIYVNELIKDYGVKRLIRIGSCGALTDSLSLRDVVLATGACTDSGMNTERFGGKHFAPVASFPLLRRAVETAESLRIAVTAGNILSADAFYAADPDGWKLWASYGVLAVEMETAELYTLAARNGVEALTILTVSDNLVTGEATSAAERERTFTGMMEIALRLA